MTETENNTPTFIETLSEDFRTNEAFKDIESADALANKHIELLTNHTELQGKLEKLPTAPETPDAYSDVDVPEGVALADGALDKFKPIAHELGMSDEAFNKVVSFQYQMIAEQDAAIKEQHDTMVEGLKAEWKSQFDEKIELAKKVASIEDLGLGALLNQPDPSGEAFLIGNNPMIVKALVRIGELISPDTLAGAVRSPGSERPKTADGRPMLKYKNMPGDT